MATLRAGCLAALLAVAATVTASGAADAAALCYSRKVMATGKSATMTFFAKTRARAAWIQKVSADGRLGPVYSQWLRAKDRRLVCRTVDQQYICLAAAVPCRSSRNLAGAIDAKAATLRNRPL